jgi:tetrahydromethanopterin S-methyltransferase subunit B
VKDMSQTTKGVLKEKSVDELSVEIEELKSRVKCLETTVNSLKLKLGRKWI